MGQIERHVRGKQAEPDSTCAESVALLEDKKVVKK